MSRKQNELIGTADILRTLDELGFPVFIKTLDGRFTYANPTCASTLRLSDPKEAVGKTDHDFFDGYQADAWREEELKVCNAGDVIIREDEAPMPREDGTLETRTVETSKLPIRDIDGNIVGLFGVCKHVNAGKILLERYRLAVEGSRAGVWHRNIVTGETWFSPRWKEMLGFIDEEFPNKMDAFWSRIHPDDVDRVRGVVKAHLDGKTSIYENEFLIRHKNGTYRSVRARGMAKFSGGKAIAFAGSHSDSSFYQQVIDTIPSFVFVKDINQRFKYVNTAVAKAYGRSKQELIGKTDVDLYDAGAKVNLDQVRQYAEHDKNILVGEIEEIELDEPFGVKEKFRMLHTKKVPLLDNQGRIEGLVGTSTDITELQKERDLLNNLMEYAEDGIFFKDRQHLFTRVNRRLAELVGVAPGDMIGKTDHDYFEDVYADDAHAEEEEIFATGKPVLKKERFTRTAQGDQWREVTKVLIKDQTGEIAGLAGISRDVTDSRTNRQMLEQQNELLEKIINALPQCIFIKNRKSEYVSCNSSFAARKNLSHPREVQGKTDYDFWEDAAEAEKYQRKDQEVMARNEPSNHYRETQRFPDGTTAVLETSKIPLHDRAGNVEGLLGIYEDITKRLEEENREADRKIARSIGHCLKGWIAVLEGTCLALKLEHGETSNVLRLEEGIGFLKHATKLATAHLTLDAKRDSVVLTVDELVSRVLHTVADERISFQASGRNSAIRGLRFHLENAILELVVNAQDFAPKLEDGGRISVQVELQDECVLIHVEDNGSGVANGLKESLFELFTTSADHRTGMGLGYVKRVIDAHDGIIKEIGQPGEGAHFVVYLPLIVESA